MDKILSITDRLKEKQKKRYDETFRRKAEAVQRTVHCSSCRLSCAMCGSHFDSADMTCPAASASSKPNLCEICRDEYNDFLKMANGDKGSGLLWHNREWMKLWSSWVEFHKALRAFRNSKEFKKMTREYDF